MGLHLDSVVLLSIVGSFLALGLLGKGPQAFYGPLVFFGVILLLNGLRELLDYRFWFSLGLGIASFIGWFLLMYLRHGEVFLSTFVSGQILGRFIGDFTYSKGKL